MDSVTASDLGNAKVYAILTTRDLFNDVYANNYVGLVDAVSAMESTLTPIFSVNAGETVDAGVYSPNPFTLTKVIDVDNNNTLVDLHTLPNAYLYVWANTQAMEISMVEGLL